MQPNIGNTGWYLGDSSIRDAYWNILSHEKRLDIIWVVSGLPAVQKKSDFLLAVNENPIVIVQWETGSGKTTQLPKYLHIENPHRQIVVTQPRVISAIANANRVALECLAEYGHSDFSLWKRIGYRTWRGKSSNHISPLSFHTDGLELMRQAVSWNVPDYLILDEVHNFAIPTEIIAMLRKASKEKVKLIIMSATLDPNIFREYYKDIDNNIPLIEIPWRTFPVVKEMDSKGSYFEKIASEYRRGKNILLFVPGKKEIESNIQALMDILGKDAQIFPLHAEIPKDDQEFLLKKQDDNRAPRIIVATNVAEESITIDYIDIVVDLGTHKVARYNHLWVPWLYLENTSDANCKQRSGRAGRTHPGEYFRYNNYPSIELNDYPEAPIEREMIDRYILILLSEGISIIDILQWNTTSHSKKLFFHTFNSRLLQISIARLHGIWALTRNNEITALGYSLLKFPVDVYHARMLYEWIEKWCSGDLAMIVAILEKKWFLSKDDQWKELKIANSNESDLFGYVELFKLVTGRTISAKNIKRLIELGIDKDQIQDFLDRNGECKLYEIVDLDAIWVKNKKVKEIDEALDNILKRLDILGVPLQYSPDSRIKRTCIATGLVHDTYTYLEDYHGFQNSHHKWGVKDKITFRWWNVSTLIPRDKWMYLWYPFIVWWSEEKPGINLLTFITVVDHGIIKDAHTSNQSYARVKYKAPTVVSRKTKRNLSVWSIVETGIVKAPLNTNTTWSAKWTLEINNKNDVEDVTINEDSLVQFPKTDDTNDGLSYIASMDALENIYFNSDESAKEYYLRYCLPLFLMEHNGWIRKYIHWKSSTWQHIFRELLARFLVEESHRIKIGNMEKTERSFRHDTWILQRFQESDDQYIKYFRLHGRLPEIVSSEGKYASANIVYETDDLSSHEVFQLQAQFARVVGESKQYIAKIDVDEIQEFIIERFLSRLDSSDFSVWSDLEAYNELMLVYESLKWFPRADVVKIAQWLKSIAKKRKSLEKMELQLNSLQLIQNSILSLSQSGIYDVDVLDWALQNHVFSKLSPELKRSYNGTIVRAQSDDLKQKKRGRVVLNKYILFLNTEINLLEKEIQSLKSDMSFVNMPVAGIILPSVEKLIDSLFEPDYARIRIKTKITDIVRALVRDNITEKKWLQKLLFDLFNQTHAASHMFGVQERFRQLNQYNDSLSEVWGYSDAIFSEVKKSKDTDFINHQIEKATNAVKRLKMLYSDVMKNPLYLQSRNRK